MSDDAIHDILEQTESDPAFQALFDLFDYSNYGRGLALPAAKQQANVSAALDSTAERFFFVFFLHLCFQIKQDSQTGRRGT